MRPTTFFAIAFPFLYRARRSAVRSHVRGISTPWYLCLELGDLVESEIDRGLTFEQRNKHRELTAFGLDFANGSGKPREGTFLDGDGFSHLEVDLSRKHAGNSAAHADCLTLDGCSFSDLDGGLQHLESLLETQRRRVVGISHEARHTGGVANSRPAVFV